VDARTFEATVVDAGRHRIRVPVPFDPDEVWGAKPRHHVTGTLDGRALRAVLESVDGGHAFTLGPAWTGDHGPAAGATVQVRIAPEGPQRADLPEEFAAALDADPAAGAFFDALAQFYRKAYLTWISGARRDPERYRDRINTVVGWLAEGRKSRPAPERRG
jgi:Bacteriocin-protection, YdeI or OmpD-Associated/Domain of unknown function (DUF1905)